MKLLPLLALLLLSACAGSDDWSGIYYHYAPAKADK